MVNPGEPWWKEYRRQQFKLQRVSIELILRKSLKDAAKEYLSNSSLSCVSTIANTPIAPYRAILLIVFCGMLGTTGYFTAYTISNTLGKPLIVSMESSTYPISDIDFPAVALCNINRISKKTLQAFAKRMYLLHTTCYSAKPLIVSMESSTYPISDIDFPAVALCNINRINNKTLQAFAKRIHKYVALHNESLGEVEWWLYQYGRLLDFTWDDKLDTHPFMDIRSKYHINTSTIFSRMKKFAPNCEEMLLKCYWAGQLYNCTELFTVRRTFRGHCCVFNYVLDYNAGGSPRKTIAKVKRQVEPGAINGLVILVDPLMEDYGYPLRNIHGFDVFLFDPAVYPDPYVGRVVHRVLEVNNAMYIELQSIKQVATNEVRKYPWRTRNCLFRDENPMFGDMYSYAACLIHCRIKSVQSLCKCTPYFLPANIQTTELCTMEKLRCLNKYKEKLLYMFPAQATTTDGLEMEMQDSLFCPECLPDCEFTKHFTRVSKLPVVMDKEYRTKEFLRLVYKNLNSTNKSILSIYQTTADGTLDRLDVVSYWFEVLSNFGGFAGLIIGFSMISVSEIIYFFCIRFFQRFYMNYKLYR